MTQNRSAVQLEFVASRVTAEVVVILEQENTRVGLLLAIEVRCREATDAAPHDDQIVEVVPRVVGFVNRPPVGPPVPGEFVSRFERTRVASP